MTDSYYPKSLSEALELRRETGAIPFAGGTDLMVRFRAQAGTLPKLPHPVLFLGHLEELRQISMDSSGTHIGASALLSDIGVSEYVHPMLSETVMLMASPPLRNLATLAGNIGNASPAGDAVCSLIALDASVVLASLSGERTLLLEEFITGPGKTVMKSDEFIREILVPADQPDRYWYRKVGTRKANALSKLSLSAMATVHEHRVQDFRAAFGAVGPVVIRRRDLEAQVRGMTLDQLSRETEGIVDAYRPHIIPIDDQRSQAVYRLQASLNLLRRWIDLLMQGG